MKRRASWRWLTPAVLLLVAALAGALVVGRWDEIAAFPWRWHWGYVALAVVFHSLALGVTFVVWHLMVARLSGYGDLAASFRIYYLSTLAKRVPTSLPYIGGRLVMYGEVGVSKSTVLNCILLENLLIGIAGVFTFLIFMPLYAGVPDFTAAIAVPGLVLIAVLLVRPQLFVELTNRALRRLGRRELDRVPSRRDILAWSGLYILPWLFAGAAFYCLPRAFTGVPGPGLIDSIRISTVTMLVALMSFVLPGGLGLKELASGALLVPWMPFSTALILSLAYRLLQTANEIGWALLAAAVPSRPATPAQPYANPDRFPARPQSDAPEPNKGIIHLDDGQ